MSDESTHDALTKNGYEMFTSGTFSVTASVWNNFALMENAIFMIGGVGSFTVGVKTSALFSVFIKSTLTPLKFIYDFKDAEVSTNAKLIHVLNKESTACMNKLAKYTIEIDNITKNADTVLSSVKNIGKKTDITQFQTEIQDKYTNLTNKLTQTLASSTQSSSSLKTVITSMDSTMANSTSQIQTSDRLYTTISQQANTIIDKTSIEQINTKVTNAINAKTIIKT